MLSQLLRIAGLTKQWPTYTRDEIATHCTPESLWIVAGDSVYDVTALLGKHPGGDGALHKRGGGVRDCTQDFLFHGRAARKEIDGYKIGEVSHNSDKDVLHLGTAGNGTTRASTSNKTAHLSVTRRTKSCSNGQSATGTTASHQEVDRAVVVEEAEKKDSNASPTSWNSMSCCGASSNSDKPDENDCYLLSANASGPQVCAFPSQ